MREDFSRPRDVHSRGAQVDVHSRGAASVVDTMPATLTYFAGWGLAEQGRWCLAAGGIPFVNRALATHEEFVALRDSGELLFGQLPLLEIDGLKLVQSQAICRHVAKISGMAGKNPGEEALADMVAEAVRDARGGVTGFPFTDDPATHAQQHGMRLMMKQLPWIEAVVQRSGEGTVCKSGITYADVLIAEMLDGYKHFLAEGWLDSFPALKGLHKTVLELPGVAAYLQSEQRYPFPQGEVGFKYVMNVQQVLHGA